VPSVMDEVDGEVTVKLSKRLRQIDGILRAKGIALDELEAASVRSVGFWQAMHKDEAGDAVITDLARIEFAPSWETGPAWPVIQRGPEVHRFAPVRTKKGKGWRVGVALPDMQIGFMWGKDGTLVPIHDEAAIAIAIAIIRDVQPDVVVMHGDNADFAEWSRFRLSPVFAQTTQPTIDRCTLLGQQIREAAPNARIVWLAGNHEERLPNHILDNARAAFGLKRGQDVDGWPVLSMPNLCRFDDTRIEWLPGYPANRFALTPELDVIHGHYTGPNGTVAKKYLAKGRKSVLFGHVHSAEHAEQTDEEGWQRVAASAGCLCRTDGLVPSTKSGTDDEGHPVTVHEDWQQGLFVIDYKPSGAFSLDRVSIRHGWARWRGQEYGEAA